MTVWQGIILFAYVIGLVFSGIFCYYVLQVRYDYIQYSSRYHNKVYQTLIKIKNIIITIIAAALSYIGIILLIIYIIWVDKTFK